MDVDLPRTPEQQRKLQLFMMDKRSRFNAILSGELAPEESKVSMANITANRPALDFTGAIGDEINDQEGAFSKSVRAYDAARNADPRLKLALQTRQTEVHRENRGQTVQAQAAAFVKAQQEAAREQEGAAVRTFRNIPVVGNVMDASDTITAHQQSERIMKVTVENAEDLSRRPKGFAGKSNEGLAEGGNE